uniref:ATXR3 C-terminal domain-containing protein n=2 Tax=Helianthus annuus TaxID=4232 RepID=A0A251UZN7_HELAN
MISFHCQQLGWNSSYSVTRFCLNNPKILVLLAYVIQRSLTPTLTIAGRYQWFDPFRLRVFLIKGFRIWLLPSTRYMMTNVFGDPKRAPPLLERLSPKEVVSHIWKGEGSFVEELIQCIAPHLEDGHLREVWSSIRAHDPSSSDDVLGALRKSLIWLQDEVQNLPCSPKCWHDAAVDLIHIYGGGGSLLQFVTVCGGSLFTNS